MSKKPNILFILSDQHNAKVLGHKGHPEVKTPNLDRMADEGIRFDNAITQNPICTPSRISWLSGQYCHNHGYYGLSGPNPNGLPTILGHFRKHGYYTGAIGKIHCPEYWVEDDCDEFYETCGPLCSIGGSVEYNKYLMEKDLLDLEDHISLREFGEKGTQSCDARVSNMKFEDSHEGWIVSQAQKFMDMAQEKEQSFFLHVSLPKPHQCYTPSEPFWSMYDEDELSLPPNAEYDMSLKAPHLKAAAAVWKAEDWILFEPKTYEAARLRKLHGYLGNVSHVDHAVGKLLDYLNEMKLAENTIVVYSSDHGDYACEHGIMEKAPGICSDAITRIPFIWRWPGKFKSKYVINELVETVDFAPTVCNLAGIDLMETGDGKDISRLLTGENEQVHSIGVTEFAWSKSVRKGKYRFIYYPKEMFFKEYPNGFGELYDLEKDPWEMNNLFFQDDCKEIIEDMKNSLLDWIITTTRPKTSLAVKNCDNIQNKKRYGNCINSDGKFNPTLFKDILGRNYL